MYLRPDLNKIAEPRPWKYRYAAASHREIPSLSMTGIKRSYQLVLPAVWQQQAGSHATSTLTELVQ